MALITKKGKVASNAVFDALIRHPVGGNGGRDFWLINRRKLSAIS